MTKRRIERLLALLCERPPRDVVSLVATFKHYARAGSYGPHHLRINRRTGGWSAYAMERSTGMNDTEITIAIPSDYASTAERARVDLGRALEDLAEV